MAEAAHPQHDDEDPAGAADVGPAKGTAVKNPFPATMVVPDVNGEDIAVALAVVEGVVYAPDIDKLPVNPTVRQYITQFCAAWSSSVLTAEKLEATWPAPAERRHGAILFQESQLHAMLGLAGDERLLRTVVDDFSGEVRFLVESPRLPALPPLWSGSPPVIGLPVAAFYEGREQ